MLLDGAVKVYHTSSAALPQLEPTAELVALTVVPVVGLLQVALTVRLVEPTHSSLLGAGGGVVIQMVKVVLLGTVDE